MDGGRLQDARTPDTAQPAIPDAASDAANHAGSDAGNSAPLAFTGPSYQGSVNNGAACEQSYPTRGFRPADTGEHPLFLYFVGTAFIATDPGSQYDGEAPLDVAQAMARRGYVSLSVAYDNGALAWLSDHKNQLACMFDASKTQSLIHQACALEGVNCELGIATWGHSQGGLVAIWAHDREPRVRGAWATGYGTTDAKLTLPTSRLRVCNGEADTLNGTAATLNAITGLTPADCPNADSCLRADGSGWIIVRKAELADPANSSADHCWFNSPSCNATLRVEPSWVDPASTKSFALESNADWLAAVARKPY